MPSPPPNKSQSADEYNTSRSSKFRFKSKRSRPDHDDDIPRRKRSRRDLEDDEGRHAQHHSHHKSRRKHRKQRSPSPSELPPTGFESLDSNQAFQESLFDALADDEGAAYWEGVYGQPIHTYPDTKVGPDGELEQMSDEEYARFVRGRMYEKTHQHIIEERERREEARKRKKKVEEDTEKMEDERREFEAKVQESLRRGEERRMRKRWKGLWEDYLRSWEAMRGESTGKDAEERIPWPVLSRKRNDVSKDEVERFMKHAPPEETDFSQLLKTERVRWHPDKMQQRLGQGLTTDVIQSITAVFQIVDSMWSEVRKRGANG